MIAYIRNKFRKYILTLLDNVIDKGDIAHYVEQAVDLEQVAQYAAKHLDLADLVAERFTAVDIAGLKVKRLAEVSWCADDIRTLRPNWDDAKCNAFLDANEDDIQCAMVERGWDAIRDLLRLAEHK